MAGVSTKEIKNRIRSMESTRQITKAMEMVAASKLRRAQHGKSKTARRGGKPKKGSAAPRAAVPMNDSPKSVAR